MATKKRSAARSKRDADVPNASSLEGGFLIRGGKRGRKKGASTSQAKSAGSGRSAKREKKD